MGPVSQTKVWLLGGATLAAGLAVSALLFTALRSPDPRPDPAQTTAAPEDDQSVRSEARRSAEPDTRDASDAQPDTQADAQARSDPSGESEGDGDLADAAPRFDVVRIARDGGALVAGTAAPGAALVLRVDDETMAETAADAAGQFVALFSLEPSDAVQIMTLEMSLADGRSVMSDDRVVLSPRPPLAQSQPDPVPQPDTPADDLPGPVAALPELPGESGAAGLDAAAPALSAGGARPDPDGGAGIGQEAAAPPPAESAARSSSDTGSDTESETGTETGSDRPDPQTGRAPEPDQPAPRPQALSLTDREADDAPDDDTAPDQAEGVQGRDAPDTAPSVAPAPVPGRAQTAAGASGGAGVAPDGATAAARAPVPAPDEPQPRPQPAPDTAETDTAETDTAESAGDADDSGSGAGAPPPAFVLRGSGEVALLDRAPEVMGNVVIDTIAYSAEGAVQISGRAADADMGAELQIYLDNQPVATARADNGDWSSDLPDIDPGVYTLRVDQLDAQGDVASRFETPFQREDPELVEAARAAAPPPDGTAPQPGPDAPGREGTATGDGDAARPVTTSGQSDADGSLVSRSQAAGGAGAPGGAAPVSLMTVQPGHSLWRISEGHYGAGERYVVIYSANRSQIRDPDLIYPGQVFVLPDED
ncbi:MAG: hypothetical protein HLUCCA12_07530 [Rhodobacteraceae bacterium HLUCCA12]|nr:MAG: hypothetical protein HLUCCA12_07530 [Rhodobacteraceae bacterium HLUCCA12]